MRDIVLSVVGMLVMFIGVAAVVINGGSLAGVLGGCFLVAAGKGLLLWNVPPGERARGVEDC